MAALEQDQGTHRSLAVGLLAIAIVGLFFAVFLAFHFLREGADRASAQLATYRTLKDRQAQIEASITQLQRSGEAEGPSRLVAGASSAQAAANLQAHARALTERFNATVQRTQVMPSDRAGSYAQVTISIRITIENEQLRDLLHALETGRPSVYVNRLQIRPQIAFTRRSAAAEAARPLNVLLELSAYWKPGAA